MSRSRQPPVWRDRPNDEFPPSRCPDAHRIVTGKGGFRLQYDHDTHTTTYWCTARCDDGLECGWRMWPDGRTVREHRMVVR